MVEQHLTISTNRIQLRISNCVIDTWKKHRQVNTDMPESFGVLIGCQGSECVLTTIEDVTSPLPNDRKTRQSFLLVDKGHQKRVDAAFEKSDGALGYLGTWHTHPEKSPRPSAVDINDWYRCTKRNQDRELFFFIVGIEKTKIYTISKNTLKELAAITL